MLVISPAVEEMAKRVIGAAIEVHRTLGPGFLECIYEEALAREFEIRDIPYERQKVINVTYKNFAIGKHQLDFLVDGQLVVELKAVECFASIHLAQTLSYLKATRLKLALLINFQAQSLIPNGIKRVISSR